MAKSSCIPAAWSLMSDLDGQLCLCKPERERGMQSEAGSQKTVPTCRQRTGRARISDWSPRSPGNLRCAAAVCCRWIAQGFKVSRRTSGGHWQSAPEANCFLARAGRFLQNERGLCLRTQGWFQLTLQGSVPPETWNMDRLPYTGPSVGSATANQISTTELVQKCYFSSLCRCLHRFLPWQTKFLFK